MNFKDKKLVWVGRTTLKEINIFINHSQKYGYNKVDEMCKIKRESKLIL